ncbi:MAG: cytochrome c4 [Rhodospirillales bacterium]|nr:cytochrome c4 [Rhodospirillales bacterium]
MLRIKSIPAALAVGVLAIFTSINTASAEMASVQTLASPCAGCHGVNGVSVGPATPSIAGLTEAYFLDSMATYKSGKRKGTIMSRIAKGYTDEETKAMAKLFASMKFGRTTQMSDAGLAAKGKELHAEFCDSCHEQDGRKADGIGVLGGQIAAYLDYTIADFYSGVRTMEKRKAQKMNAFKAEHGADGIKAVVQFYASQK